MACPNIFYDFLVFTPIHSPNNSLSSINSIITCAATQARIQDSLSLVYSCSLSLYIQSTVISEFCSLTSLFLPIAYSQDQHVWPGIQKLNDHLASKTTPLQVLLSIVPRVIFLKCKRNHVAPHTRFPG